MDRNQYEEDLRKRQEEHLKNVRQWGGQPWQACAHDQCQQCHGTGVKLNGEVCVHMLACRCPKCQPYSLMLSSVSSSCGCHSK
jgi:hypothetical protein